MQSSDVLRGSRSLGLAGLNVAKRQIEVVQRILDFPVAQEDREDFRSENQRLRSGPELATAELTAAAKSARGC